MSEVKDIELFNELNRLKAVFQAIGEISYTANQTKKRYPAPEMMNTREMQSLVKFYLALGFDIEEAYKKWKKIYDKYKEEHKN